MTTNDQLRLIAYSIVNGGNPDLSKLSKDELRKLLSYVNQLR